MRLDSFVMPVRKDWNAMGWRLPAWFKRKLKRLDPTLVLQFMPPGDIDPKGVSPETFPAGVWVICRKMRRTGWLHRRWVMNLANPDGSPMRISPEIIRVLRTARDFWRRGEANRLEKEFDNAAIALQRAESARQKDAATKAVVDACRKHAITEASLGKVAVRMGG